MRLSKKTCAIGLALGTPLLVMSLCWVYRVELFVLPREWAKVMALRSEIEGKDAEETDEVRKSLRTRLERILALNGKSLPPRAEFSFWSTLRPDTTLLQIRFPDGARWSLISSQGRLKTYELDVSWQSGPIGNPMAFWGRPAVLWTSGFAFECASDGIVPLGFFTDSRNFEGLVPEGARTNLNAVEWRRWNAAQSRARMVASADANSSRNRALRYLLHSNVVDDSIANIEALLEHPDEFVRARAIATLGEAPTIPWSLTRFLDSPDSLVRGSAQRVLAESTDSALRTKALLGCITDRRPFRWDVLDITLDSETAELAAEWIEADPQAAFDVIRNRLDAKHTRAYLPRLLAVYEKLENRSPACRYLSNALCRTGDRVAVDTALRKTLTVDESDIVAQIFRDKDFARLMETLLAVDPPADVPKAWIESIREGPMNLRAHALLVHWNEPNGKSLLAETLEELGDSLDDQFDFGFDGRIDALSRSRRVVDFIVSLALEKPREFSPAVAHVLARSPAHAMRHKRNIERLWRFLRSRDLWVAAFSKLIENAEDSDLDALVIDAIESARSTDEARVLLSAVNGWSRVLPVDEQILRRWMKQTDERSFSTRKNLLPSFSPISFSAAGIPPEIAAFERFEADSAASAEGALLLLRSKPEFVDEFFEHVTQPGNKWLLSSNVCNALSPQVLARLKGVEWPTEDQQVLWRQISAVLAEQPRKVEDLSLWEQYQRRLEEARGY